MRFINETNGNNVVPANQDSKRLEWMFENGMSKLDKCVVFGDDVSLDNFRERIDALMLK